MKLSRPRPGPSRLAKAIDLEAKVKAKAIKCGLEAKA